MFKKIFFQRTFFKLLIKTLNVINKRGKRKFVNLLILVILQAIFDVISLASLVPLIQIISDRSVLEEYLENIFKRILNISIIENNNDLSLSIYIPFIVIIIMIISTIIRLYVVFRTNKFIEETRHQIASRLMDGYINGSIKLNSNTAEIAKSILSEVDQFIIIVFQPTILMLTNLLVLIAIVIYLLYSNLTASISSLILLIFFYFSFYVFSKRKLNFEGYKSEKANKGRFSTAIESFKSIKDIKIYSAENYFSNRFKIFSKIFAKTNATYSTLVASPKYILEMLVFISLAIAILIISLSNSPNFTSLPLLGIFAFAAYRAQPALSNIIYGINSIEYGSKIISNLFNALNNSDSKKMPENLKIKVRDELGLKSTLTFKEIGLIYDHNNKGIKEINFSIKCPSLFLVVGPSGSGKSTLLNIISGIIKPNKGEIIFCKKGSRSLPKISYLHQEYSLFDTTIAENIAFGVEKQNINYEHLKEVLKKAELYSYVRTLKNKVYERVGENGCNLSIGQRQRVALARALYFNPDILLLDEPTSSLDTKNEKKIIDTLINLSKNITVIMATHKINFIPDDIKVGHLKNDKFEIKNINQYSKENRNKD
tara:strand:+ start:725 stop:2518 length:1794 start_codon:yes stop_codon:yes gene_type:complete